MLLCLWERLVSAVIMWSCWVCTLAQCLCILDTIYHSVLRIARNKSTPPPRRQKKTTEQNTHISCPCECAVTAVSYIYSWIHSVCTPLIYVFRLQKSVEVATAGVPQIPFCSLSQKLCQQIRAINLSRCLPSQRGTACRKILDLRNTLLLLAELKAVDTTMKKMILLGVVKALN